MSSNNDMKKTLLYLRTDLYYHDIVAGGSVGHTLGVIQGFLESGYEVVCVSTCMIPLLKNLSLKELIKIKRPSFLRLTRWHLGCFIQSFFILARTVPLLKKYMFCAFYQRYSIMNITGVLLKKWYAQKFILEYNGSEVFMGKYWSTYSAGKFFSPAVNYFELLNLRSADIIIVVSVALKDELVVRGIQEQKIVVNPNGVNPEQFDSARFRNELVIQMELPCAKQL